jgi:hypothetical protein
VSKISESGSVAWLISSTDDKTKLAQRDIARLEVVQAARSLRISESYPGYSFLHLLNIARERKCSKRLDKIYRLLGLTEQSLQDELSINYRQKPANLYLTFAKYWILRDLDLKILKIASYMRNLSGLLT